jgi:hypothetical protein
VIEQVPEVKIVTVVPLTVQTLVVFELKVTAKPLEAVAETVTEVVVVLMFAG